MVRLLITSGPTHEPIDAVRYLGNRSSGKIGSALAQRASDRGWSVRMLLGPQAQEPKNDEIELYHFQSSFELETLLRQHLDWCDCLIMAAAVADFRPKQTTTRRDQKLRRTGEDLTLSLESTPDLLAMCSENARPDQLLVGFALEPKEQLESSALSKLERKNIDLIIANPIETVGSNQVHARLIGNFQRSVHLDQCTPGLIDKHTFADWLFDRLDPLISERKQQHA